MAQWLSRNTTDAHIAAKDNEQMVTRVQQATGGNRKKFLTIPFGSDVWVETVRRNCSTPGSTAGGPGQVGKCVVQPSWLEMAIFLIPWTYYHTSDVTNPRLWMSKFHTSVSSVSNSHASCSNDKTEQWL